jgi:hypothetical protein
VWQWRQDEGQVVKAIVWQDVGGWRLLFPWFSMHLSTILWIVGGTVVIVVVAISALVRRGRPDDLGSVSTTWTTEHNTGYRGGDGSAG